MQYEIEQGEQKQNSKKEREKSSLKWKKNEEKGSRTSNRISGRTRRGTTGGKGGRETETDAEMWQWFGMRR